MKARFLGSILLLLALVQAPFAQQDQFDFHVGSLILLQDKAVQAEVGITKAQRDRMNKFAESHREDLKKYGQQLQATKTSGGPDQKKLETMFLGLKKKVFAEMSAKQLKRLREISLQSLGFAALNDEIVATRVGINKDQLGRIRKTFESGFSEAANIEKLAVQGALQPYENRKPKDEAEAKKLYDEAEKKAAAARQKVAPRVDAIRTFTKNKIMSILTPQQKTNWANLQGSPFRPK